eukprot:1164982-Rhodomonas_salina.2
MCIRDSPLPPPSPHSLSSHLSFPPLPPSLAPPLPPPSALAGEHRQCPASAPTRPSHVPTARSMHPLAAIQHLFVSIDLSRVGSRASGDRGCDADPLSYSEDPVRVPRGTALLRHPSRRSSHHASPGWSSWLLPSFE